MQSTTDPSGYGARYADGSAGGLSLLDLLVLVRRYPWTVLATAAAVVAAGTLWVGTEPPVYRASASILVDTEGPGGGVLGELASLTTPPAAAKEMALLRSRSIAEQTVAAPGRGVMAVPDGTAPARHLGLTTLVDNRARLPLATLWRRLTGERVPLARAFASVDSRGPGSPERILVEFVAADRVRLALPGPLGLGASGERELPYHPGRPLEYEGLVLRLDVRGDPAGQVFVVSRLSERDAVKRLMDATDVVEVERNTDVVAVSVDDSDPHRAADAVNALCANYLELNVERGRKRASRTLEFIENQLERQEEAVEEALAEVVSLQASHPEVIDVSAAAQALITRSSELTTERIRLGIASASLGEAIDLLREGDARALSRPAEEALDTVSRSLIAEIGLLTAQLEEQGRSDTGPYKLMLQERLSELEAAHHEAGVRVGLLESVVDELQDGRRGALARLGPATGAGGALGLDPMTASYLDELARLEAEANVLAQEFTAEHPPLLKNRQAARDLEARVRGQMDARLAGLREEQQARHDLIVSMRDVLAAHPDEERERIATALERLEARALTHIESRREALARQDDQIAREVDATELELSRLPESQSLLAEPTRRLETHNEIYRFLLTSKQQAEITHASTIASADLVDPAIAPAQRYAPRMGFAIVVSGLLGVVLGVGLAFVRERMRGCVYSQAELEEVTGLPIFGAIPDFRRGPTRAKSAGSRFLALRDEPQGAVAEAYRALRANLRFVFPRDGERRELRSLAVTSTAPNEGKSTTNVDLALAIAGSGKRVLLVDADMRKPSVHDYLARPRSPGMTEVVTGERTWRACVQESVAPNLDLITAGSVHPSPGDLFASPRLRELRQELEDAYDVVVFDLPPALAVSDVASFAHELDAILLLYRAGGLPKVALQSALTRLRQTGANVVGAVLNAVRPTRRESHSYGYGYGYGEYGGRRERS